MNGLEAIDLMKQGKMVIEVGTNEPFILRIENGIVWFKNSKVLDGEWVIDDCFDFTIDYEEYVEKQLTGWERVDGGGAYIVPAAAGSLMECRECWCKLDEKIYERANYFSTKEKAEEIDFKQTLFRKLQRFSDENGGNEIDFGDGDLKYCISYSYFRDNFVTNPVIHAREFGQIYFVSREVAEKAIELFRDDLIKYFGDEWSEGNE